MLGEPSYFCCRHSSFVKTRLWLIVTLKSISASVAVRSVWRCCAVPVSALAQMRPSRSLIGLPIWGILLILKKIHQSGQKPQRCHRFKKKKKTIITLLKQEMGRSHLEQRLSRRRGQLAIITPRLHPLKVWVTQDFALSWSNSGVSMSLRYFPFWKITLVFFSLP